VQILVVDDSKAMRMIVIRELKRAGHAGEDLVEADSGAAALDVVGRGGVDLVLSDWNMPGMSGLELLRALRAAGYDRPFGFITTESASSAYSEALESGATFLIGKPFTADELGAEIRRAFEGARSGA
jgi:two-component system chemotaxis response regulator CheY